MGQIKRRSLASPPAGRREIGGMAIGQGERKSLAWVEESKMADRVLSPLFSVLFVEQEFSTLSCLACFGGIFSSTCREAQLTRSCLLC